MTDLDPALRLAFSLRSQPGSYALLLGSGVSRSAGVPTGYQVLLELIGEVAAAMDSNPEGPLEDWFKSEFDVAPTYDNVLDHLTLGPAERRGLLRRFFEPTEEEAEQGLKRPTVAHLAIAALAKAGAVSIILETNFDRLMEGALDAVGVAYVVASTPGALEALKPLHLQPCIVVKLHGDYLDTSMLNTASELAGYSPETDALLDRVLDEYGLVVTGWSAAWDVALRHAMERATTRRFGTYWVDPGEIGDEARSLVAVRDAVVVRRTADEFLSAVADYLQTLTELNSTDPVTVQTAVALAKRSLEGSGSRIALHDALRRAIETLSASAIVTRAAFQFTDATAYQRDIRVLEADAELATALIATCAYWGDATTDQWWLTSASQFAEPRPLGGSTALIALTRYPSTILVWAAGIAGVAARRWDLVKTIIDLRVRDPFSGHIVPLIASAAPERLLGGFTPTAGVVAAERPVLYLQDHLRPYFTDHLLMTGEEYTAAAEMFDYLTSLFVLDFGTADDDLSDSEPVRLSPRLTGELSFEGGSFAARPLVSRRLDSLVDRDELGPLPAGLFGGVERLRAAQTVFDEQFANWKRAGFFR